VLSPNNLHRPDHDRTAGHNDCHNLCFHIHSSDDPDGHSNDNICTAAGDGDNDFYSAVHDVHRDRDYISYIELAYYAEPDSYAAWVM
jgi:hypothetical protein